MKRILFTFMVVAIFSATAWGQAPKSMKYQTVVRDASGQIIAKTQEIINVSILQGSETGSVVCSETFTTTTNEFGLVNLQIGSVDTSGFDTINWANGPYFTKVILNGTVMGISQLLSVPYALYAENSSNSLWKANGSSLYYNDGNVGIGTTDPIAKLDVRGVAGQATIFSEARAGEWAINASGNGTNSQSYGLKVTGGTTASDIALQVKDAFDSLEWLRINGVGNVGIGVIPYNRLEVGSDNGVYFRVNTDLGIIESIGEFRSRTGGGIVNMIVQTGGNVGIGTTTPSAKLEVIGHIKTSVLEITGGQDLAEPFPIVESLPKGSVVIIDENNSGHLIESKEPYDKRVAGIVSGAGGIKPGLTLKQEGLMEGNQDIALSGRVYVLATTENGAIRPGDRLTTSSIPGHAMKATNQKKCDGAVIGKAMSSLDEGDGLVLVLVNLQ